VRLSRAVAGGVGIPLGNATPPECPHQLFDAILVPSDCSFDPDLKCQHRADDAAKHQQRDNKDAEHSFSGIIAAHRYLLGIESSALSPTIGCATTERWI
jgi:hypothetical protein